MIQLAVGGGGDELASPAEYPLSGESLEAWQWLSELWGAECATAAASASTVTQRYFLLLTSPCKAHLILFAAFRLLCVGRRLAGWLHRPV